MKTIFVVCMFFISFSTVLHSQPPLQPIFRLNSSLHSGYITAIDADRAGEFIVTSAYDKTVKLWSAKNGALLTTYRLPIGARQEGELYACAISPDGNYIAAGGYTGWDWYRQCVLFIIDRKTGNITAAVQGFPNGISSLDFSPDGKYIAVGLGGTEEKGIVIVDVARKAIHKKISDFTATINDVQFLPNGNLLVNSMEGILAVYSSSFTELKRISTAPEYFQDIAISPDGKKVAALSATTLRLSVYDSTTLQKLYEASTAGLNAMLFAVAWSLHDHLFASGTASVVSGNTPMRLMRVWSLGGKGAYHDIAITGVSTNVQKMTSVGKGAVVFGGLQADIGLMSHTNPLWYHTSAGADFTTHDWKPGILRVNDHGTAISFTDKTRGDFSFDIRSRRLSLRKSIYPIYKERQAGLSVSQWFSSSWEDRRTKQLMINGYAVPDLGYDEWCRSLDIADDGSVAVIGGTFSVLCYGKDGTRRWSTAIQSIALDVNISSNGKLVVGAFADGVLRWFRMSDGRLLASLFMDVTSRQWIMWTPEGYYDCSDRGDALVGWHMNNGIDKKAEFFDAAKFFDRFYHPEVVAASIQEQKTDHDIAIALGLKSSQKSLDDGIKQPPKVNFIAPTIDVAHNESLEVEVMAEDQGGGVGEIRLYHNGKIVADDVRKITVKEESKQGVSRKKFTVLLTTGENILTATALAHDRSESNPVEKKVMYTGAQKNASLYALIIGINTYKNSKYNLNYAKADADAYAALLRTHGQSIFEKVTIEEVFDTDATKENIQAKIHAIAGVIKPEDVFVLYYAGHGVMSEVIPGEQSLFFLIPTDVVKMYLDTASLSVKAISAVELKDWCALIKAQKQLIIFDACQSGGALTQFASRGAAEEKAIVQLARSSGVVVMASTGTEQFAAEFTQLGHGVFTYALLEGLQGKADGGTRDGKITVKELEAYINDRVPELTTQYRGEAQYPTSYSSGQDFPILTTGK